MDCRDYGLSGFCICRDFEPVGILDFGILSFGILACRDFEFRDFVPYPKFIFIYMIRVSQMSVGSCFRRVPFKIPTGSKSDRVEIPKLARVMQKYAESRDMFDQH